MTKERAEEILDEALDAVEAALAMLKRPGGQIQVARNAIMAYHAALVAGGAFDAPEPRGHVRHHRAFDAPRPAGAMTRKRAGEVLIAEPCPMTPREAIDALDRAGAFPDEATLAEIDAVAEAIFDYENRDPDLVPRTDWRNAALRLATACRKLVKP